jgi:hypothetical protein
MECDGCKVRGNLQSSYVHSASSVASQGNTFISELGQLSDGLNNTSTIGCLFFLTLSPLTLSPLTLSPLTLSPLTLSPLTLSPLTSHPLTSHPLTSHPLTSHPLSVCSVRHVLETHAVVIGLFCPLLPFLEIDPYPAWFA